MPSARGTRRREITDFSTCEELDADLLLMVRREDGDDAVDRLRGIQRVQGGEHEMARLGGQQGGLDCLVVAHLADQNHVRILAQCGAQGAGEGVGIDVDLALVDDRLLVAVQELDGVLDGDDVLGAGWS